MLDLNEKTGLIKVPHLLRVACGIYRVADKPYLWRLGAEGAPLWKTVQTKIEDGVTYDFVTRLVGHLASGKVLFFKNGDTRIDGKMCIDLDG